MRAERSGFFVRTVRASSSVHLDGRVPPAVERACCDCNNSRLIIVIGRCYFRLICFQLGLLMLICRRELIDGRRRLHGPEMTVAFLTFEIRLPTLPAGFHLEGGAAAGRAAIDLLGQHAPEGPIGRCGDAIRVETAP